MATKTAFPLVSIVVCTYNRKKRLEECLRSILKLEYPRSRLEIIVIDGGSVDGTDIMVKRFFPEVRFIVERAPGVAIARNLGALRASGTIIVYTDDDCLVDKKWLKELLAHFSSESVIAVGGSVLPASPIPKELFVEEALGLLDIGSEIRTVEALLTSNFAVRQTAFDSARFETKLGRRGSLLFGGEDTDFCRNLRQQGYRLIYNPYARVYHQISPERLHVVYILKHAIFTGISYQQHLKKWEKSRFNILIKLSGAAVGQIRLSFARRSIKELYHFVFLSSALIAYMLSSDRIITNP